MINLDFIYPQKSIWQLKNFQISKKDILKLLQATPFAPSPKCQQNWHFIIP